MIKTDFLELAKEYPQVIEMAQKCGVTMDELNDCIKAMSSQSMGYAIKNVEEAAKGISKILKKLKQQEQKVKS